MKTANKLYLQIELAKLPIRGPQSSRYQASPAGQQLNLGLGNGYIIFLKLIKPV